MDEMNRRGFDALSEPERTLVTVWLFESRVANGGFAKYYRSAAGDLAGFAPAALAEIGATQLAALAAQANGVFGPAGPPRDREARRVQVEQLDPAALEHWAALEAQFFDCPEDIDELLERHLESVCV